MNVFLKEFMKLKTHLLINATKQTAAIGLIKNVRNSSKGSPLGFVFIAKGMKEKTSVLLQSEKKKGKINSPSFFIVFFFIQFLFLRNDASSCQKILLQKRGGT